MNKRNITKEQIESVVLDNAIIMLNYGEVDERLLAPCKGGVTCVIEQEIRQIERDGARGKEKGLRRIIEENATITASTMDISIENIKLALAGATDNGNGGLRNGTGNGIIKDLDYLKNVTAIGTNAKGESVIFTIYNALADNGLSMEYNDKDEMAVELAFAAHYNVTDVDEPLYNIEIVESPGTYTVSFEVTEDGTTPVANAIVEFNNRFKTTNANGVVNFFCVPPSTASYTVAKAGYVTESGDITVTDADITKEVIIAAVE